MCPSSDREGYKYSKGLVKILPLVTRFIFKALRTSLFRMRKLKYAKCIVSEEYLEL
jgi:hypothetical protein